MTNEENKKIEYKPQEIEARWQKYWRENKTFSPSMEKAQNPFYNLMMFPYPSAEGLHVGNMYAFTGADVYGRFKRMHGNEVFEPIGLDGFGIHSENYALKVGRHPREQALISQKNFYRQLEATGNAYDWSKTLETYDPAYYKWTQWLFIQMFKKGLAYRKSARVNWCPSDKTVLADEQVIDGKCERDGAVVEKRELEQWFFKITEYADRLLAGLERIDWPRKVKIAQENWIGKSKGAVIGFSIDTLDRQINVFTTRPDTLYGATFMVLSPEHPLILSLLAKKGKKIEEYSDIENEYSDIDFGGVDESTISNLFDYVSEAKKKTDSERQENKEKTGVFSGLYCINPVNNEKITVWVADYVLMGYGTGAIMAVPAHDTRDFEFAKKFDLPIKQVIMPCKSDRNNPPRDGLEEVVRETVIVHLRDKSTGKFAVLDWHGSLEGITTAIMGGVESNQTPEDAALTEIKEEAGLENVKILRKSPWITASKYCASHKNENRKAISWVLLAEVEDLSGQKEISLEEKEKHTLEWVDEDKIEKRLTPEHQKQVWQLICEETALTGGGELINSGEWDGFQMPSDMDKVLSDIEAKGIGASEANYHLRDWLISRQRYWGPPIPMIFCASCEGKGVGERSDMPGWYTVPEKHLPIELPEVEDWRPEGEGTSPLANHPEFYETKCPSCNAPARRETDVSDTFLDSAWYFLRYLSTGTNGSNMMPYDIEVVKKWCPTNIYIGGAEHSVLHLLYVRFVTMVLHDLNSDSAHLALPFEEPFPSFFAHGLIVKDGAKMSKSRGNVVVPDSYISKFGADTLRLYLMFLGQFKDGGDFRDSGIEGMHRFVKRVWTLLGSMGPDARHPHPTSSPSTGSGLRALDDGHPLAPPISKERLHFMHKTIKGVTEDIANFSYNTAIAKMMEWYNFLSSELKVDNSRLSRGEIEVFLKLLAPFAPHMAEELWYKLELGTDTIHKSEWPTYDEKYLVENSLVVAIQVNGKLRGQIEIESSEVENQVKIESQAREDIARYLINEPKKVIYIPGKIINFVI